MDIDVNKIMTIVAYLDTFSIPEEVQRIIAKKRTLAKMWETNQDPQLAECIEKVLSSGREGFGKPFLIEDSGGYNHIVLLEKL